MRPAQTPPGQRPRQWHSIGRRRGRAHVGDARGPARKALQQARPQRALLRLLGELEHGALDLGRLEVGALLEAVEAGEHLLGLGVAVFVAAAQVLAQRRRVVCAQGRST